MIGLLALSNVAVAAGQHGGFESITLGNLAGAGAVIIAVLGVWLNLDKRRRETAKDAREDADRIMAEVGKLNTGLGTRVDRIEQKVVDFMPRTEIERIVTHEKSNRALASQATADALRKHSDDIVALRVELAKVEQKHDGLEEDVGEIKMLLKEQRQELNTKLEKMETEAAKGRAEIIASLRELRDVKAKA